MEKRMYFFVPYNISDIQKGIQAGHAALEYARKYYNDTQFIDFADNHKTWVILNGGTTNKNDSGERDPNYSELKGASILPLGSLDRILRELILNEINYAYFNEPDLNDALSAICFICDQRVWDRKLVPDWEKYCEEYYGDADNITDKDMDELGNDWIEDMGGKKNVFLRELISGKRLA